MFIFLGYKQGVFWLNIDKFEVNLRYRYCSNLFRDVRKESEFRQYRYRNSTKSRKDKKKKWEREIFDFRQQLHRNSFCPVGARSVSVRKENQLWQWHCRNREIFFFLTIVAMPLLEMGGKKNSGCRNHI